jgi:ATP-dependent Clp protease ATP-binding subunit ClpA
MSEYKGEDALAKLIGGFGMNKNGILTERLREKPYCVVLFDEFEKSNPKVLDLFLQILDEGYFSDSNGDKVNLRNAIIIATSNADSDLIYNYSKSGFVLSEKRQEIINDIIERGIYRPELLNRFDNIVLFQPLSVDELKKISTIFLAQLENRLKEKGIRLKITDALITKIAEQGMNPVFGARPIEHYIQDKIESLIADKIIREQISQGDLLEISPDEI